MTAAIGGVAWSVFVGLLGCAAGSHRPAPAAPVPTVTPTTSVSTTLPPPATIVAQAVVPSVKVYVKPEDPMPSMSLPNPRPLGGPLVLVVREQRPGWLYVSLPVRPNGTTGWIQAADVTLSQHDFRITVEEAAHRITFSEGYEVIDREPIAIGTEATPTPGGVFYTVDFVKLTDPGGPYGPYAFGLSGFSDVLTSFAGGPGQLAIHGTNEPWVLGHDASHGCIRMSNAGIARMAQVLPLGVPVTILA